MCSVYYEGLIACFHPPLHTAVRYPCKIIHSEAKNFHILHSLVWPTYLYCFDKATLP